MSHELFFFSNIESGDAMRTAEAIKAAAGDPLTVHINSRGGDAFEAFGIYNLLRSSKSEVTTVVHGLAASAASVIMMAGDSREMSEASQVMIHNSRAGMMAGMTAAEMQKAIPVFEQIDKHAAQIYSTHTGIKVSDLSQMMAEEKWLTAKQAKKLQFATSLNQRLKAVALFDPKDMNLLQKLFASAENAGVMPEKVKKEIEIEQSIVDKVSEGITDRTSKEVEEKEVSAEGTALLLKDQTPYTEHVQLKNEIKPLLEQVVEYIATQPTKEEINAAITEQVSAALVTVLGQLRSSTVIPGEGGSITEQTDLEFSQDQEKKKHWREGIDNANSIINAKETLRQPAVK